VLGTLPGEESLRRQEYYAHPRNLFWPIVYALFGETVAPDYPARVDFVRRRRIALWDVCAAGTRLASADATIRGEEPNAIDALLASRPNIGTVAFNGSTAKRLFQRYFKPRPGIVYLALPSTSPAHARLGFTEKFEQWSVLRQTFDSIAQM
jgi:hypoxanthine-DNA glycosylase